MREWVGRATAVFVLALASVPFGCSLHEVDINGAGTGGAAMVGMVPDAGRDSTSMMPWSPEGADAGDARGVGEDAQPDAPAPLDARDAPDTFPDASSEGLDGAMDRPDAADAASHGAFCADGRECSSGHCIDGVCCDAPCDGVCQSCNQVGKVGHCAPLAANARDPDCGSPSVCGRTGFCDGAGKCAVAPVGTLCQSASCSNGVARQVGTCDSQGACVAGPVVDCGALGCNASGTRCSVGCPSGDAICAPGSYCIGDEICLPKKKNGEACAAAHECLTDACVDGLCCEQACEGPCVSCTLPGLEGRCMPVAAGQPEPKARCVAALPETCGLDGLCDGKGSCQLYPKGKACAASSCAGGTFRAASSCDGAGTCVPGATRTCAPYRCDPAGAACLTTCQGPDDCVAGVRCSRHECQKMNLPADCATDADCASGYCSDGVCCDVACQDRCYSCTLADRVGICSPLPADQRPDGAVCP